MNLLRREIQSDDGTKIPVWLSGSGPPLLIIHGAATNHRSWNSLRPYLQQKMTVAAIDRRATSGDPFSNLDLQREFEDVAAVARSLGPDVSLFGHSSGALCALGAALLLPDLKNMMLYEPPLEEGRKYPKALIKLNSSMKTGDIDGVYDAWLKDYVGIPPSVAEELKASPIGKEIRAFAEFLPREMAAHLDWNAREQDFTKIQARTTYFVGSETPLESDLLRGFEKLLENSITEFKSLEISGQGHFANFLNPGLLAELIIDCVNSV